METESPVYAAFRPNVYLDPDVTPFMFTQTREDPMVEISVIKKMASLSYPISICMIASAGDTLCSILAHESKIEIQKIDVVDTDLHQLHLAKLKMALVKAHDGNFNLKFLSDKDEIDNDGPRYQNHPSDFDYHRLRESNIDSVDIIFGGRAAGCYKCLSELYQTKLISKNDYDFWLEHLGYLVKGINQIGKFELLFKLVMDQENVDENFDKYFSHDYLTKVFGVNATKYSMNKPFSMHFKDVLSTYQKTYPDPKQNYFYHQFIYNCYPEVGDLPLYLKSESKIMVEHPVNFFHSTLLEHIKYSNDAEYDIIQLSNITDWLDPKTFCELLDEIGRALRPGGKIIMRRLNSDVCIAAYLKTFYEKNGKHKFVCDDESSRLDQSHFYSEVLVITKIN